MTTTVRPDSATPRSGPTLEALPQRSAEPRPGRDRYIDTLRAAALLRVLLFHLFGWFWLPLLFPSMGVMFAMAGSLMAASLDRAPRARTVLFHRIRRLLPPLWALGAVLVPLMIYLGWTADVDGSQDLGPNLAAWFIPVIEPPGSDAGYLWTLPLWYLRTYLWLVLLSPALLWLWRHWPRTMYVLPLLGVALASADLMPLDSPVGEGLLSVFTFAACWMVGFARYDGTLQRTSLPWTLIGGALLCAAGIAWAVRYPIPGEPIPDVSDIPMATALFNLGFSMVLLRLPLTFEVIDRIPLVRGVIDVVNRRAVTIYLWGNVAISLAWLLLEQPAVVDALPVAADAPATLLAVTLLLLTALTLAVGWVEDLAARRRPQLVPITRARRSSGIRR